MKHRPAQPAALWISLLASALALGCSDNAPTRRTLSSDNGSDAGSDASGPVLFAPDLDGGGQSCEDGKSTSVRGTVFAPKQVPLVFQVGKWRRKVLIPELKPCERTTLADRDLTRLPRHRGEGDLPRIAVVTGRCDSLSCLISRLGIDSSELGIAGSDTAITFYSGSDMANEIGPTGMYPRRLLLNNSAELEKHDMVLLSCSCDAAETIPTRCIDVMNQYLSRGGRLFATHLGYRWQQNLMTVQPEGLAPKIPVTIGPDKETLVLTAARFPVFRRGLVLAG